MSIQSKEDLQEWVVEKIDWLKNDTDVKEGGIPPITSCGIYDEAKGYLVGLQMLDAIDALGSEPPCVACVPPETNAAICDLIRKKLTSLLALLSGDKANGSGVDPKYQTKPLSPAEIEMYMTGSKGKNPSQWLGRMIRTGFFSGHRKMGRDYIMNYMDFPSASWQSIVTPDTWSEIKDSQHVTVR